MADTPPISNEDPQPTPLGVLPSSTPASTGRSRKSGGPAFHKNPNCPCGPCAARRRREEALLESGGDGGSLVASPAKVTTQLSKVNADRPVLVAQSRDARSRIADWIMIRAQEPNLNNKQIAERLGIAAKTLNGLIARATTEGWLTFDDPLSRVQHEIVPRTVDNLAYFLAKRDKSVTIETAKGTIFKQFQAAEGINDGATTILAVKIEMASSPTDIERTVRGVIVGQPRTIIDVEQ